MIQVIFIILRVQKYALSARVQTMRRKKKEENCDNTKEKSSLELIFEISNLGFESGYEMWHEFSTSPRVNQISTKTNSLFFAIIH